MKECSGSERLSVVSKIKNKEFPTYFKTGDVILADIQGEAAAV